MNKVGRILLLVGVVVLALLVGVLIGRNQQTQPTPETGNASAVQITTAPPPPVAPPTPLPAPVQAPPQAAAIPKITPDQQVQEDAAAVGMTTRESGDQGASGASAPPAPATSTAAAPTPDQTQAPAQPNG